VIDVLKMEVIRLMPESLCVLS